MRYKIFFSIFIFSFLMLCCKEGIKKDKIDGNWNWTCCDGKYSGHMTITTNNETMKGVFIDGVTGDSTSIEGSVKADSVFFNRFHQNYIIAKRVDGSYGGNLFSRGKSQSFEMKRPQQ